MVWLNSLALAALITVVICDGIKEVPKGQMNNTIPRETYSSQLLLNERKQRLLVKTFSTRSAISLATTTKTVPLTCALMNPVAGACQKRRLRKAHILDTNMELENHRLFSGLGNDGVTTESPQQNRKGRFHITLWRTTTTAFTITSTSTNNAITFSVSFLCTINGMSLPGLCG